MVDRMSDDEEGASLLDGLIVEDIDSFADTEQTTPNARASRPGFRERLKGEKNERQSKASTRVPPKRKDEFVQPLTEMYTMLGVAITPFDSHCGPIVIQQAEPCARSLDELAAKNEAVRKALRGLTSASALGNVIMAHAPIIIAVAAHHMPGSLPFRVTSESDTHVDVSASDIT
jgi:hypothetical protein